MAPLAFGSGWTCGALYEASDSRLLALVSTEAPPRIRVVLGWDREMARLGSRDRQWQQRTIASCLSFNSTTEVTGATGPILMFCLGMLGGDKQLNGRCVRVNRRAHRRDR